MYIKNKKEIMDIIEDENPIEPSGSTRADQIAREVGNTGEYKQQYQNLFIEILEDISKRDWFFFVKIISFVRSAKFEKVFYEAFASFIKNSFSETDSKSKEFVRGRCIEFVAREYKELFDFQWIKETSPYLIRKSPWAYLDIVKIYEPENFLLEMDNILTRLHKRQPDLTTEILNYGPQMLESFPKKILSSYFKKWKKFVPENKQKSYQQLVNYYFSKNKIKEVVASQSRTPS